jgi:predicted NAD-dependent protein-ADP-ribosyltransferase YbiA (DUF1768 family)
VNTIKCSADGCTNIFQTEEALHPQATYQCKLHTTVAPDKNRFQEGQFDKNMRRARKPTGTAHIKRQGSETNEQEWIQEQERLRKAIAGE